MGALPNYRKTPRKNISCISESLARLRWTFGRLVEDLCTDQMAYYPPTGHGIRADKERDLILSDPATRSVAKIPASSIIMIQHGSHSNVTEETQTAVASTSLKAMLRV